MTIMTRKARTRTKATTMQVFGPPDTSKCTDVDLGGPEGVSAYLMAKYGTTNPDRDYINQKSVSTFVENQSMRRAR